MKKINLGSEKVSLLLIPDKKDIMDFGFSIISSNPSKNIIYVTLEKSKDFLMENFSRKSIPTKNIFTIDCVSAFYKPTEHTEDCYYALAPYELKDISMGIKHSIKKDSIIIFDSLTNLISYSVEAPAGINRIKRFVESISEDINNARCWQHDSFTKRSIPEEPLGLNPTLRIIILIIVIPNNFIKSRIFICILYSSMLYSSMRFLIAKKMEQ